MNQTSTFLKQARQKAGLSQKQVANKMGYTTAQFISNWERNVSMPPEATIKKLAKILKVREFDIAYNILTDKFKKLQAEFDKKYL